MRKITYSKTNRIKLRRSIVKAWMKDGLSQTKAESLASKELNRLEIFGPGHIETIMAGNTVFQVRIGE